MDNYNRNNRQRREYENNRRYNENRRTYDINNRRMDNRRGYDDNGYNNMRRHNNVQYDAINSYSVYARRPIYREDRRRFENNRNERRTRKAMVPTKEVLDADLAKYMRGEVME